MYRLYRCNKSTKRSSGLYVKRSRLNTKVFMYNPSKNKYSIIKLYNILNEIKDDTPGYFFLSL